MLLSLLFDKDKTYTGELSLRFEAHPNEFPQIRVRTLKAKIKFLHGDDYKKPILHRSRLQLLGNHLGKSLSLSPPQLDSLTRGA